MVDPRWLEPIAKPAHGGCACCPPVVATFDLDCLIAVGFGFAACLKDGLPVLEEPQPTYGDDGLPDEETEVEYATGHDAEKLAAADPDHDWRIQLESPLSGRTYQRQGTANWVLVEQNEGFA